MAVKAQQVEFLLSENAAIAGGTATFYTAGSSHADADKKTIWQDRNKTTPAANPVTLDAVKGTATVFADGIYDVVLKNAAGAPTSTLTNIEIASKTSTPTYSVSFDFGGDLAAALASPLTAGKTLIVSSDITCGNLVRPSDRQIRFEYGGRILPGAGTSFDWNGGKPDGDPRYQIFGGSGDIVDLQESRPDWFGGGCDGITVDTVAIQAAIDSTQEEGTVLFRRGVAWLSGSLTLKQKITMKGEQGTEWNEAAVAGLKFTATTGDFLTLYDASTTKLGVTIQDLIIDANGTTGKALNLGTSRSLIERCTVKNGGAGSVGIYFIHGGAFTAVENRVRNCFIYGFGTGVKAEGNATDGLLLDSFIYGNDDYDIYVDTNGWQIKGNHTYVGGGARPVSVYIRGQAFQISGNYVEAAGATGIKVIISSAYLAGAITNNLIMNNADNTKGIVVTAELASAVFVANNTLLAVGSFANTTAISVEGSNTVTGFFINNLSSNHTSAFTSVFTSSTNYVNQVSNRIDTSAATIKLLAASSVSPQITAGFGSPEGVTTAAIGSIFTSYNLAGADNGAHQVYAKASGAGNTGWRKLWMSAKVRSEGTTAPTSGTWNIGDIEWNTAVTAGGYIGWTCVTAGTEGTLSSVTGSITTGTASLVVNSTTGLAVGNYIAIAGVTGKKKITAIVGTTVTIDSNADATVSSAAVSYSGATFKTFGAISP